MTEDKELYMVEIDALTDRIVQLEDMRRETEIITLSSHIYLERQKLSLLTDGKSFAYQQGGLDAWEQMLKVLEGKTNFHEFVGEVKSQMKTEQGLSSMEVG